MYVCRTSAHVPAGRMHNGRTYQFTLGPANVEYQFANRRGEDIPENYLHGVETQLALAHQFMCAGHVFEYYSDVFYAKVFVSPEHRRIVFYGAKTRPCAEKRGFAKIFLLQMCRSAAHLQYDLHIIKPSEESLPILERAFGRQEMPELPFEFPWSEHFERNELVPRFVITWQAADAACAHLTPQNLIQLVPYPPELQQHEPAFALPRIRLHPSAFPTAAVLNAEPVAVKEPSPPPPPVIAEWQRQAILQRDRYRRAMRSDFETASRGDSSSEEDD